jgi:hypothetical protein
MDFWIMYSTYLLKDKTLYIDIQISYGLLYSITRRTSKVAGNQAFPYLQIH